MKQSIRVRHAIHCAATADEIGHIVQEYLAGLPVQERSLLEPKLLDITTYSDSVVGQKALEIARAELFAKPDDARLPLLSDISAVLSAAALKLAVIELEAKDRDASDRRPTD